jgi:uncharacterized GH25 family protein
MLRFLLPMLMLAPLTAHDFWIQPSAHRARSGDLVKVRLMVGERGKGEGLKRNPDRYHRFSALMGDRETSLTGLDGADPAGFFRPQSDGLMTLVYAGKPSRLELPAIKFEAYLREEGLTQIIAARQSAGRSTAPGRERFVRSAKALVQVGDHHDGWDRPSGLRLEFIPQQDPFLVKVGESLSVNVRLDGQAISGLRVTAIAEDGTTLETRTDEQGRAAIRLDRTGRWIFKAVHMLPVTDDPTVDWESLWASLTFQI